MSKKILFTLVILVIISVFGIYKTLDMSFANSDNPNDDFVACTMEAKICPDGSSVGRTGPKCEFAKCPGSVVNSNTSPDPDSVSVNLGKTVELNGLKVTPVKIVENSLCPKDVQCIWAGTVIVKTRFERVDGYGGVKELDVELNKSMDVLEMWVSLSNVELSKGTSNFTYLVKHYTR